MDKGQSPKRLEYIYLLASVFSFNTLSIITSRLSLLQFISPTNKIELPLLYNPPVI